jgi:hypothetical protein
MTIIIKRKIPINIRSHETGSSLNKHRNCIRAAHIIANMRHIKYIIGGGPVETNEISKRALNPINRTTGVHISILLIPQDC